MNKLVEKIKKLLEERLEAVEEVRRKHPNSDEKHTWDVLWCEYKSILMMIDKNLEEEKEEVCNKTHEEEYKKSIDDMYKMYKVYKGNDSNNY